MRGARLLLIAVFVFAAAQVTSLAAQTLRVMSFNVRTGSARRS